MQIAHSCIARTASKHALVKSDELLPRRKMTVFQSLREQIVEKEYGTKIVVYGYDQILRWNCHDAIHLFGWHYNN